MKNHCLLLCALVLWTGCAWTGFARLLDYATTAGGSGPLATRWPTGSCLISEPDQANLILLAHPHCPCTRASLDELEQLLIRGQGLVAARVLFYRPRAFPESWERTGLWHRAAAIPGVQVFSDEDGVEARRFGARTSGHVLLYHADGRLLFQGGITNVRGHAGASVGSAAILSLLTKGTTEQTETPVFGCPLYEGTLP